MNVKGKEIDELHNIAHITSIKSIMKLGILSNYLAANIPHMSVADEEIQRRRNKKVPNDGLLHSYANLYFHARNPMLCKIMYSDDNNVCILRISIDVLNLPNTIITDMNAACDYVKFMTVDEIDQLDVTRIYAEYWNHDDPQIKAENKKIKCAEVLIKDKIPPNYIIGAYVKDEEAMEKLEKEGFKRDIMVNINMFFNR